MRKLKRTYVQYRNVKSGKVIKSLTQVKTFSNLRKNDEHKYVDVRLGEVIMYVIV